MDVDACTDDIWQRNIKEICLPTLLKRRLVGGFQPGSEPYANTHAAMHTFLSLHNLVSAMFEAFHTGESWIE